MSNPVTTPGQSPAAKGWPWAILLVAAAWSIVIRLPLVANAAQHLDSDLAVDGFTLLDATQGHWRWHYPGTPYTGIVPVVLSLPQSLIWGVSPITLVSGGVVAWLFVLLATFLLAWRTFGPGVACWSLFPLTFASAGAIWLSGRITGGHLIAAAWHAFAFALLAATLQRPSAARAALLGLWCGLGVYVDSMFVMTLAGLVPVALVAAFARGPMVRGLAITGVATLAFLVGLCPRLVGTRLDPYDAYPDQFALAGNLSVLASHSRLLALECLPRLLAGHRLPSLETDPDPGALTLRPAAQSRRTLDIVAVAAVACAGVIALMSIRGLALAMAPRSNGIGAAIVAGLVLSAFATLAAFVVNRNIFNSDNYRYLVTLLVPWSIGFGRAAHALAERGRRGRALAGVLCASIALLMTIDVARWYARFGWLDDSWFVAQRRLDDPALAWLASHPEVGWVSGGYWEVYRLIFLADRYPSLRGAPFPIYPNRIPEWQPAPGTRAIVVVRPTPEGTLIRDETLRAGGRVLHRERGFTILAPP
jgi:hypothetical protein